MKRFCLSLTFFLLAGLASGLMARELANAEEVIRLARSSVGSEGKLTGVQTLHYHGTFISADGERQGEFDLYLKKPKAQRLELTFDDVKEVTAVNGFEGYFKRINLKDGEESVRLMDFRRVERVALNSFENLHFFGETRKAFGRVKYEGLEDFRGQRAHKLVYSYPRGMTYTRYFAEKGGDLIGTVDERGTTTLEVGEQKVDGLTFAEKIETYDGDTLLNTVEFDTVRVNPELDEALFEVPLLVR